MHFIVLIFVQPFGDSLFDDFLRARQKRHTQVMLCQSSDNSLHAHAAHTQSLSPSLSFISTLFSMCIFSRHPLIHSSMLPQSKLSLNIAQYMYFVESVVISHVNQFLFWFGQHTHTHTSAWIIDINYSCAKFVVLGHGFTFHREIIILPTKKTNAPKIRFYAPSIQPIIHPKKWEIHYKII